MPIRWRLTLFNALVTGCILLTLSLALFVFLRNQQISNLEDSVKTRAVAAADGLEVTGTRGGATEVRLENAELERLTLSGVFILVRAPGGDVLTQTVMLSPGRVGKDDVWRRALATGRPASGTVELSRQAPDYVYAVPVRREGKTLVLEAGRSYDSAEETTEGFLGLLAAVIGAAFLLSLVGAYLLARSALRPVDSVTSAAREMTEGDLSRRLPIENRKDEIGRLTVTMNGLLARLEAAFARREEILARQRRFAADASHELRTPVTAIRGHSRMLKKWGLKDPQTALRGIAAIEAESERMQALVESLLMLTRGDDGAPLNPVSHDLGEVAEDVVASARVPAEERSTSRIDVAYGPPERRVEAQFDRGRVREAASIILDNALKYTPPGGRVEVAVRDEGEYVALEVSDTGVGIPEEQIPLVFERFHRTEASRTDGGSGLGLSIARQIAESHGGRIEVVSTPGSGSTFTLLLPKRIGRETRDP